MRLAKASLIAVAAVAATATGASVRTETEGGKPEISPPRPLIIGSAPAIRDMPATPRWPKLARAPRPDPGDGGREPTDPAPPAPPSPVPGPELVPLPPSETPGEPEPAPENGGRSDQEDWSSGN